MPQLPYILTAADGGALGRRAELLCQSTSPLAIQVGRIDSGCSSHIGWAVSGGSPSSNLLTLLAAGHTPGIYLVSSCAVVRTILPAGTSNPTYTFKPPSSSLASVQHQSAPVALQTAGFVFGGWAWIVPLAIVSDGTSPITARLDAYGITGSGLVDYYASASLQAPY